MKKTILTFLISSFMVIVPVYGGPSTQRQLVLETRQEKAVPTFGIKIKFLDVLEDSRCPEGRACVWEGNAKVRISVWSGRQKPIVLEVNSALQPQVVNYGRYEIRLAALDPRPTPENGKPSSDNYVATFTVRKLVK